MARTPIAITLACSVHSAGQHPRHPLSPPQTTAHQQTTPLNPSPSPHLPRRLSRWAKIPLSIDFHDSEVPVSEPFSEGLVWRACSGFGLFVSSSVHQTCPHHTHLGQAGSKAGGREGGGGRRHGTGHCVLYTVLVRLRRVPSPLLSLKWCQH